jgi:hypothetical protein
MSRTLVLRCAVVALLLGLAAAPAAAIPFCWNCTCNHKCTTRCFDGVGFDVCGNWLCQGSCELQPSAEDALFAAEPAACDAEATAAAPVEAPADGGAGR